MARSMGKDAERKVAVCCDSWVDKKNVSERKTLSRSGHPILWWPFVCPLVRCGAATDYWISGFHLFGEDVNQLGDCLLQGIRSLRRFCCPVAFCKRFHDYFGSTVPARLFDNCDDILFAHPFSAVCVIFYAIHIEHGFGVAF